MSDPVLVLSGIKQLDQKSSTYNSSGILEGVQCVQSSSMCGNKYNYTVGRYIRWM